LNIAESRGDRTDTPGIYRFRAGNNGDPVGKIKDFVSTSSSFAGLDVAMVKICYVDLDRNSDAAEKPEQHADN